MRYWWVNQNQTYRQEIGGGYLWSPQRKSNGARNAFYESMREVAPGDLIFSFVDTRIRALGIVRSYCYECPKPAEFGSAGMNWDNVGWRVDVKFVEEPLPIRPKYHIQVLAPLLPEKYSPISADGNGSQSIYLTELPRPLAQTLATLVGRRALDLFESVGVREESPDYGPQDLRPAPEIEWEQELTRRIEENSSIPETEKSALIMARRGQGVFKRNVRGLEGACRVTKVDREEHLRASHCKPWRNSSNEERLDGENGLLLTPSIDHLFDRGFISFEKSGRLLLSPVAHSESLRRSPAVRLSHL